MDFSRIGVVEADGAGYCAHAQPRFGRKTRHIRGPCRPDQQAAQVDLDSMREAARGMSREDGYAAMDVEADALKAVTGGAALREALSLYPFEAKEGQDGAP